MTLSLHSITELTPMKIQISCQVSGEEKTIKIAAQISSIDDAATLINMVKAQSETVFGGEIVFEADEDDNGKSE